MAKSRNDQDATNMDKLLCSYENKKMGKLQVSSIRV